MRTAKGKIFAGVALALLGVLCSHAAVSLDEKPIDPFDFNFCGGERVYPIVGVNIATACGPRNQIALGRRGKISWSFPAYASEPAREGSFRLTDEQLGKLSLLAEVTQVASPPETVSAPVMYKLGINFSARRPAFVYAPLTDKYTPANSLLQAMLELVPDHPRLPDCEGVQGLFDPTLHREDRLELIKSSSDEAVSSEAVARQ
jgi:hypothetical protein